MNSKADIEFLSGALSQLSIRITLCTHGWLQKVIELEADRHASKGDAKVLRKGFLHLSIATELCLVYQCVFEDSQPPVSQCDSSFLGVDACHSNLSSIEIGSYCSELLPKMPLLLASVCTGIKADFLQQVHKESPIICRDRN